MSTTDFPSVVKYLDHIKSRVPTPDEVAQETCRPLLSKYAAYEKARAIKKIPGYVYIPNHMEVPLDTGERAYIGFQWNYVMDQDFVVHNYEEIRRSFAACFNCQITIRYRVDDVCFRYFLVGDSYIHPFGNELFHFPLYAGEVIKKNFTVEIWIAFDSIAFMPTYGVNNPDDVHGIKLFSGQYRNPTTPDETEYSLATPVEVKDDLFITLPEDIPTDYPDDGPHINNI